MKKFIFVLLLTIVSAGTFAQKVKVDKKQGVMTIDKIDAASVNVVKGLANEDVYTFGDLKSNDKVTLQFVRDLYNADMSYFIVTSTLSDKTSEMKYDPISFTLNSGNAVGDIIVKRYKFFTTDGMNKSAISNFLNTENKEFSTAIAQKDAAQKAIQDKLDKYSPTITSNQQVLNKQTKELLAKFEKANDGKNIYLIKDPENNNIAAIRYQEPNNTKSYYLYTYDRKTYSFDATTIDDAKNKAITSLILNDYMGNDSNAYLVRKAVVDNHNAKVKETEEQEAEENLKRSTVKGIATLENGDVLNGTFRAEFRQTQEGKLLKEKSNNLILDLSPNADFLRYYYQDEKGKDKMKMYSQKQVRSFKVTNTESGADELYIKLDYIEEPIPQSGGKVVVDGDGSLDVLATGLKFLKGKSTPKDKTKQTFVYVAEDNSKTKLYFMEDAIFITDKKNNRTIKLNKETLDAQLQKIAEGCPKVICNIESGMYEYTRNAMLMFTEDLEKCN